MHWKDIQLRVVAAHFQIVTLIAGRCREYDIRMFGCCRPVWFVDHNGFWLLERFDEDIGILLLVESITASHINHFHVRISDLGSIKINGFTWIH